MTRKINTSSQHEVITRIQSCVIIVKDVPVVIFISQVEWGSCLIDNAENSKDLYLAVYFLASFKE